MSEFSAYRIIFTGITLAFLWRSFQPETQDIVDFVVETKLGKVRGSIMQNSNGREFYAYRGIPYGQPPVGELRFKPPLMAKRWEGVFDASNNGPRCPQYDWHIEKFRGKEDCLNINVYVPKIKLSDKNKKLPVLVNNFGGMFMYGGGDSAELGPQKFMDKNVVLVSFNSRLNALGFVSTGDDILPGNYGLFDHNLVLQWVNQNIEAFGGDPGRVTMFGHSSGSTATFLVMLSPLNDGLLSNIISISGVPLKRRMKHLNHRDVAQKLAKNLGCEELHSKGIAECLMTKSAQEIVMEAMKFDVSFIPRVDGVYLPDTVQNMIEEETFAKIPVIIGITKDERAGRKCDFSIQSVDQYDSNFLEEVLPDLMATESFNDEIKKDFPLIIKEYFEGITLNNPVEYQTALIKLYSDSFMFNSDVAIDLLAEISVPVYAYKLDHKGKFSFYNRFENCSADLGVGHCDELQYLFDSYTFCPEPLENDEAEISKHFITLFTNFAETDNPTSSDTKIVWEPNTKNQKQYLSIGISPKQVKGPLSKMSQFWRKYLL